ncbi:MAG: zinc-binding dehydrogenase [Chlorobiales bacterium]|nr:zinc-binding dehydrogenase [Chlorobiales bacterium]
MKAIVLTGVGSTFGLTDAPDVEPFQFEAVVQLKAAALNHRDIWIRRGLYAGLKFPIIPGSDGSGVVTMCGEEIDKSWDGREVIINPSLNWGEDPRFQQRTFKVLGLPDDGTFAQYVKIPTTNLAPKPAHLSFEEAAALPLAGLTAYRALFVRGALRKGESVLITGIGGGVSQFALQFAVAFGAKVFVTSGADWKIEQAIELGATGGTNYSHSDWAEQFFQQTGGFDVAIDSAGGEGFSKLVDLLAPGGRLVILGATRGNPTGFDLRKLFWKQASVVGTAMGSPEDFNAMLRFVEEHRIVPVIDKIFSLSETEVAAKRMEDGQQFGKIVLSI